MTSVLRQLAASGLIVGALAYGFHLAVADDGKLRLTVEGGHFQYEPAYIRLRVRVEPDAQNRALTVALISDGHETSSLEGLTEHSPRTRWFAYKDVPAGDYMAVAMVYRPDEQHWYASTRLRVLAR